MTVQNHVMLSGRVAKPPQRHYRPDGLPVIQFPLELNAHEGASPRPGRNRIDVVAIGKLAELDLASLQSGQRLWVEGQLKQRHWQTPEGKNRTQTEVIATDLRRMEGDEPSEERRKE